MRFRTTQTPLVQVSFRKQGHERLAATDTVLQQQKDEWELPAFTSVLLRPYLDLGDSDSGPLHARGVLHAYDLLIDPSRIPLWNQRVLPLSFRELLVREIRQQIYDVEAPTSLPERLQTERWKNLTQILIEWDIQDRETQSRAVKLLNKLCFYTEVLRRVPDFPADAIQQDESTARLAYAKACARYILYMGNKARPVSGIAGSYHPDDLLFVLKHAPTGSRTKFNVALKLTVFFGKLKAKVETVEKIRRIAFETMESLKTKVDDFEYMLMQSGFYRGASFVPMLRGDRDRLIEEMRLSEEFARSLPSDSKVHQLLRDENLHPVLESRAKEALFLGDTELAICRLKENADLDPYDPKPYLEIGEIKMQQGHYEDAISWLQKAALYGPPSTPIAWFMMGICNEHLSQWDLAIQCHLQSLQLDPSAISPYVRIAPIARKFTQFALLRWCEERLMVLERDGNLTELEIKFWKG